MSWYEKSSERSSSVNMDNVKVLKKKIILTVWLHQEPKEVQLCN
jgi:hypothetical protein